jgi:hypothetical protein
LTGLKGFDFPAPAGTGRRSAIRAGVWRPQRMRPFIAFVQQPCLKSLIVAQGRSLCVLLVISFPAFFRHVCA